MNHVYMKHRRNGHSRFTAFSLTYLSWTMSALIGVLVIVLGMVIIFPGFPFR